MINERDKRQLQLMKKIIADYEIKNISLGALIGELEFLLTNLQWVSKKWRTNVDEKIFVLEEIYADALDKKVDTLVPEVQSLLSITIEHIKNYLLEIE